MRLDLPFAAALLAGAALLPTGAAHAQDSAPAPAEENFNFYGQATYIWQKKPAFRAAYTGENSLLPQAEKSYTFTTTAFIGWRPWAGGELYFNPEAAQGVALSGLHGLGGYVNGEMARTSGPNLKLYRARLFLRQTWGTGGGRETLESGPNQLAGSVDKDRWTLTAGNLAVTDVFDNNAYSHDPRTQFLNWANVTYGAYDFVADSRGYSWGAVLERKWGDWTVRAGRFLGPVVANGQPLDWHFNKHYGDQIEVEREHTVFGADRPGTLHLLAFRNRGVLARYRDALAWGAATGQPPDINAVRTNAQVKYGVGVAAEQTLSPSVGLFARAMWTDGRTETEAYTEIDDSLNLGVLIKGGAWGRAQDTVGLALAQNRLSKGHRRYLAAGGMGFFIGDGALSYRPEQIAEVFYNATVCKGVQLALNWQHIRNPGYNRVRGPVNVWSIRLHAEF